MLEASGKIEIADNFPIIGIGSSAGGLEAFREFFSNMPINNGMAFVLVPHLDPTRKSILSELIMKYTTMNVIQVHDNIKIEPNNVYIIPPNFNMIISNGHLKLSSPNAPRGLRLPIDFFFRSLALDQGDSSIGILFSGTGTDGTLGMREINGVGGMAMVQDPNSAEYDGMLRSAIDNALIDYILTPSKMPEKLINYVQKQRTFDKKDKKLDSLTKTDLFNKLLALLRTHSGHDFTSYKHNTILRRIERRININQLHSFQDYFEYIKKNKNELDILFKELLIGVTNFFRDKEAFGLLEDKVLPMLLNENLINRTIRMWIPGCSTGEEAYSIAITVQEFLEKYEVKNKIQIFASDIDKVSIEKARMGIYPDNIAADVSDYLLKKFFILESNAYKVKKKIREMIIFAVHDILIDPPFSKIDLISCRNLLIYLKPEIQNKLISMFHYSLNSKGYLILGNAETIGTSSNLYSVLNMKWKLFQRSDVIPAKLDLSKTFPPLMDNDFKEQVRKTDLKPKITNLSTLLQKILIEKYSPPSVIVDKSGMIQYIQGNVSEFLDLPMGDPKMNIFEMVKKGLKLKLSLAIRRTINDNAELHYENLSLNKGDDKIYFSLSIIPINEPVSIKGLIIVSFEKFSNDTIKKILPVNIDNSDKINNQKLLELEDELNSTKQYLQTTIEELETTNEELQSINEELQSSNEELQSTNEELQTSKEELQSVNEELTTVNSELESKITELRIINDDMYNLMTSSNIGTIFLDNNLLIKRFTPACKKILNIIDTDIGRTIKHISSNLVYDKMIDDAEQVLETLIPKDVDVQIQNYGWFNMRILPYRTTDNIIKGIVITFFDINDRYLVEKERSKALHFVNLIVETTRTPFIVLDKEFKIIKVNKAFYDTFKPESNDVINKYFYDLDSQKWNILKLRELLNKVISNHSVFNDYEIEHEFDKLGKKTMLLNTVELKRDNDNSMILLSIEDITFQKQYERILVSSKEKYQEAYKTAIFYKDLLTHDVNNILQVILSSSEMISNFFTEPDGLQKIKELNNMNLEQLLKAKSLVGNIQLYSKIDEYEKVLEPIDIVKVIEECIDYIKTAYRHKDIDIIIQKINEIEKVLVDNLIKDVFENVIINAIKHNDKEKIRIEIILSKETLDSSKYIKVQIIDNGPGIKDEEKSEIFMKKLESNSSGLGMGLSIVKKIIRRYNGTITVENRIKSDYSKGCNFIISLPQVI